MVSTALDQMVFPLLVTIMAEIVVAVFFGFRRALWAVVAVNFVTNPLLSAFFATLYWLGVGYTLVYVPGPNPHYTTLAAPWTWAVLSFLEVIIVIVEWRLLVWVLAGRAGTSRKLLAVAIVMNAVSATLGTLVVRSILSS